MTATAPVLTPDLLNSAPHDLAEYYERRRLLGMLIKNDPQAALALLTPLTLDVRRSYMGTVIDWFSDEEARVNRVLRVFKDDMLYGWQHPETKDVIRERMVRTLLERNGFTYVKEGIDRSRANNDHNANVRFEQYENGNLILRRFSKFFICNGETYQLFIRDHKAEGLYIEQTNLEPDLRSKMSLLRIVEAALHPEVSVGEEVKLFGDTYKVVGDFVTSKYRVNMDVEFIYPDEVPADERLVLQPELVYHIHGDTRSPNQSHNVHTLWEIIRPWSTEARFKRNLMLRWMGALFIIRNREMGIDYVSNYDKQETGTVVDFKMGLMPVRGNVTRLKVPQPTPQELALKQAVQELKDEPYMPFSVFRRRYRQVEVVLGFLESLESNVLNSRDEKHIQAAYDESHAEKPA